MLLRMATDAITATVTSVSGSASSVTLIAAVPGRRGLTLVNASTALLYLRAGTGAASVTDFTTRVASFGTYELPLVIGRGGALSVYAGAITGIWDAVNGAALVTEYT